jgi:hypothetical protein
VTAIVDREGRLFGRVNLVDAAVGLALFVVVPLAYGAFLLFRPPAPRIASVELVPLSNIEERTAGGLLLGGKLKVRGTGLRPNMRAEIGDRRAIAFVFETPASADVIFGADVPAGTHDLVLFDGVHEIARARGTVTIAPGPARPTVRVRVVGTLVDLEEVRARALQTGAVFPDREHPEAEIAALGQPETDLHRLAVGAGVVDTAVRNLWQRAAAIVLRCEPGPAGCLVGGVSLGGAAHMVLGVPGAHDLKLRIDEILPYDPPRPASIRVRFIGTPETVALERTGDRDHGDPALTLRSASIVSLSSPKETQGDVVTLAPGQTGSVLAWAAARVAVVDVSLRLTVDAGTEGVRYRTRPVKVGGPFTFETGTYTLQGTVLSLSIDESASGHASGR